MRWPAAGGLCPSASGDHLRPVHLATKLSLAGTGAIGATAPAGAAVAAGAARKTGRVCSKHSTPHHPQRRRHLAASCGVRTAWSALSWPRLCQPPGSQTGLCQMARRGVMGHCMILRCNAAGRLSLWRLSAGAGVAAADQSPRAPQAAADSEHEHAADNGAQLFAQPGDFAVQHGLWPLSPAAAPRHRPLHSQVLLLLQHSSAGTAPCTVPRAGILCRLCQATHSSRQQDDLQPKSKAARRGPMDEMRQLVSGWNRCSGSHHRPRRCTDAVWLMPLCGWCCGRQPSYVMP